MTEANNPATIFISSTFSDLVEYRDAVHSAIRRLRNHANDMIYWSADERSPEIASIEQVEQSDLMLLIVAHKYGSIVPGDSRSFTEIEYAAAKQHDIPVLAFFVEPTYPWAPVHVEVDPELREKLETFKSQVERECVRQFFTTTDSLAIQVTQAIANYDRRHSQSTIRMPPKLAEGLVLVKPRSALSRRVNLPVLVGEAEDGLPLILKITRSQEIEKPLKKIANYLERSTSHAPLDAIGRVLTEEGEGVWIKKGLWDIELPSGGTSRCYVSFRSLSDLLSPSLLTEVIPMPLMDWARRRFGPTETQITSVGARHGRDVRVQSTGGKNRFLALSVDSDQKHTVGWEKVSRKLVECPQYWREFVSESIFGFSDCVFRITERRPKREDSIVARGDLSHYGETLQHLFETNRYDTGVTYLPRFRVSVKAIAEVILGIAKRLVNLHQSGQIHGDIKPQNVLLSREGPVLIDAFPLETGETTPGLSPGWAAPEQVLLQPVSEATDIYSLGVMLSSLLKGQLTGEIIQYVIPSPSDEQGRVISFIKNPSLYLDPSNRRVALQSRIAWLDFVEKCLRFDPRERPSNAKEFIEDFRDLLLRCPIEGSVEFGIRHNEYPLFARLANGQETACRIIKDDWDEYYSRSIWRQNDTK